MKKAALAYCSLAVGCHKSFIVNGLFVIIGSETVPPSGRSRYSVSTTSKPSRSYKKAPCCVASKYIGMFASRASCMTNRMSAVPAPMRWSGVLTHNQWTTATTGMIAQVRENLEATHGDVASHPHNDIALDSTL